MLKNINLKLYVALPWPEYQEYMDKDWFLEESYYDCKKDVRLVPYERVQNSSNNTLHRR